MRHSSILACLRRKIRHFLVVLVYVCLVSYQRFNSFCCFHVVVVVAVVVVVVVVVVVFVVVVVVVVVDDDV